MSLKDDHIHGLKGYTLECLRPGTHVLRLEPTQGLLDIYIGGGTASYDVRNMDDAPTICVPNSFNYIPAGLTDRVETTRSGSSVRFCFSQPAVRIIPAKQALSKHKTPLWNNLDVAMLGAGEIIYDYLASPTNAVKEVETSFLRDLLAIRLVQIIQKTQRKTSQPHPAPVQRAIEHIEQNLSDSLTLETIAEHANTSTFHFARQFRAVMGISVRRYIILRRIEVAQRLISHTDQSLAEIAYTTGFSSQSHMTSVFRRFTGRTPGTYRKHTSSAEYFDVGE